MQITEPHENKQLTALFNSKLNLCNFVLNLVTNDEFLVCPVLLLSLANLNPRLRLTSNPRPEELYREFFVPCHTFLHLAKIQDKRTRFSGHLTCFL